MKTLTVRNVPDTVYKKLTAWARQNHRSLQEQLQHLLEQEVKLHETSVLEAAGQYRTRLCGRDLGDSVADVQEDRSR